MFMLLMAVVIGYYIKRDLIPLIKEKRPLVTIVFIAMVILVLAASILLTLDVRIPSPAGPIKRLVSAIWNIESYVF